ncbi:MAG: PTS sugar transporter [Thermodesulfobacteriota bacterium]
MILAHGAVAESIAGAAAAIAGEADGLRTVSLEEGDTGDTVKKKLVAAVSDVDGGDGVMVFTDMFGGTTTNVALSLLRQGKVEVMTGVNLPVILKFLSHREKLAFPDLVLHLKEHGRESIVLAGDILKAGK